MFGKLPLNENELLRSLQKKESIFLKADFTLAQRLDFAYHLLNVCSDSLKVIKKEKIRNDVVDMYNNALEFVKAILNVSKINDIHHLMADRNSKKTVNPEYIPGKSIRLAKQSQRIMSLSKYKQKEDIKDKTIMLSPIKRDSYRVMIKDGLLKVRDADIYQNCDTSKMISHYKNGYASYVINLNGELSLFNHLQMTDKMAHSSMNAGASVIGAGEMQIIDGKLKVITNHSGHYKPNVTNVADALLFLDQHGIDLSDVTVRMFEEINSSQGIKATEAATAPIYLYKATDILSLMKSGKLTDYVQKNESESGSDFDSESKKSSSSSRILNTKSSEKKSYNHSRMFSSSSDEDDSVIMNTNLQHSTLKPKT